MMKKFFMPLSLLTAGLVSTAGYSYDTGNSNDERTLDKAPMACGYVRTELGGSFSRSGDFKVNDSADWTKTKQGYNSDFGNTVMFGFGMGMNVHPLVSVGLSAQIRPDLSYSKRQSPEGSPTDNPDNFYPDVNPFTRRFDLENKSYMVDLFLNRAGAASWYAPKWGWFQMVPYVGASIGLSQNRVSNFRTTTSRQDSVGSFNFDTVRTAMTSKNFNKFGWQLHAGLDFPINKSVTLGVGYRYFDGGKLKTNDYTIDTLGEGNDERTYIYRVNPWEAKLRCNEVVASLTISI